MAKNQTRTLDKQTRMTETGRMKEVGIYEAKTRLARLVKDVERGETVTLTRHGHPVARIVPIEAERRSAPEKSLAQAFRELSRGNRLDGVTIRELIDEGRKY